MASVKRYLNNLAGQLFHRDWTEEDVGKYIGSYKLAHMTYAVDESIRTFSASGGAVTAMLTEALRNGTIDGALVSKTVIDEGRVRGKFFIATSADELLEARGSIYVEMKFVRDALPLIQSFHGKIAVVGLPCQIDILRRHVRRDPAVGERVVSMIALVCGHSSQTQLIDKFVNWLENRADDKIERFHFRRGHWRGRYFAQFKNGTVLENPFAEYSLYQNLYFWSEKKCFQCNDHFGYNADISAGDIWSLKLKNDPIKHTGLIVRNAAGESFIQAAGSDQFMKSIPIDVRELLDGQARTGPFHYNITARLKAALRFKLKLKDTVFEPAHWNHRLVANMAMFNWAWSQNPKWRGLIFKIPKPVLKAYLYMFKLLESF